MPQWEIRVSCAALLSIPVWLVGCSTDPKAIPPATAAPQVSEQASIDALAASIDQGSQRVTPELLAQYSLVLDTLDARCREDRGMVGDIAVRATQFIKRDFGRAVSVLEFLKALERGTQSLSPTADCASAAAPLIVLLGKS